MRYYEKYGRSRQARVVTQMRFSVALYVYCLSCFITRIIFTLSFVNQVSEPTLLLGNTGKVMCDCSSEKTELWHGMFGCCIMTVSLLMTFVQKLLRECDHPPYLPALALCSFWLFQKLKISVKGNRFSGIVNIQVRDSHPEEHSRAGVPGF